MSDIEKKIENLLENGWSWKYICGIGEILSSPDDRIYPMYRLKNGKLVPEFLK